VDEVRRIADAVLYEGYLLWPYRRSAMKNRQRWTFGGVYPESHSAGRADDPGEMRAECLVEGPDPVVDVSVRFLHVVRRQALRDGEPVDELEAGGERHLSWEEATERELEVGSVRLGGPLRVPIRVPAGEAREDLDGGTVVRSWRELRGEIAASCEELHDGLHRVRVTVRNTSSWRGGDREDALRQTFCSTHFVLTVRGGEFASLTDAPDELRATCENSGCCARRSSSATTRAWRRRARATCSMAARSTRCSS
jgi:hypothetical protein